MTEGVVVAGRRGAQGDTAIGTVVGRHHVLVCSSPDWTNARRRGARPARMLRSLLLLLLLRIRNAYEDGKSMQWVLLAIRMIRRNPLLGWLMGCQRAGGSSNGSHGTRFRDAHERIRRTTPSFRGPDWFPAAPSRSVLPGCRRRLHSNTSQRPIPFVFTVSYSH